MEIVDDRLFVAVIGGLWAVAPALVDNAKAVAEELGVELAKAGFGLVVYFSNDESLEPHVVTGYTKAVGDKKGVVRVRYAESQRGAVRFREEATFREMFQIDLFPGQDWELPFYRSLAEENSLDGVVLLGGGASTLIAGQIAVARKLPILAVDDFGGSAAKIWSQLAQASDDMKHNSWGTSKPAALVEQLKIRCLARASKRLERTRQLVILEKILSRRKQMNHALVAFSLLFVAFFFGMVYTPWPSAYPAIIFLGLVAAGATGGVSRILLKPDDMSDSRVSTSLGGIAGFVVGLAYLVPQWVGAPGILTPKIGLVAATDKIQFASAILVALSAGVGFDAVFSRLQKQAEEATTNPLKAR